MKLLPLSFAAILLYLPLGSASAGVANYARWDISEINVCFAEKETVYRNDTMAGPKRDWKTKEKEYLENILKEEFTSSRTGYSFVGFKDCKDTKNIDVVVGIRKALTLKTLSGLLGVATVGKGRMVGITSYSQARGVVVLSPTGIGRNTITHEFGHILSLQHEHDHPDARAMAGGLCPSYTSNPQFHPGYIYTDFDETSVMNYCYIHSPRGINAGLSEKDQEILLNIFENRYKFEHGKFNRPSVAY